jgi:hypothetical protein
MDRMIMFAVATGKDWEGCGRNVQAVTVSAFTEGLKISSSKYANVSDTRKREMISLRQLLLHPIHVNTGTKCYATLPNR